MRKARAASGDGISNEKYLLEGAELILILSKPKWDARKFGFFVRRSLAFASEAPRDRSVGAQPLRWRVIFATDRGHELFDDGLV
jgi:hypothetical protein